MRLLALLLVPLAAACADPPPPSSGSCVGGYESETINLAMTDHESYFFRVDLQQGDEEAQVSMKYGPRLQAAARYKDMPTASTLGTYPSSDARLVQWSSSIDGHDFGSTQVTVTQASRDRLVGQFTMPNNTSEILCQFDLRRAFEYDTYD